MKSLRSTGVFVAAVAALVAGCSSSAEEPTGSAEQAAQDAQCKQVEPKDHLIATLVRDSWAVGYPLTRLTVDASGATTGPALPDLLVGDLAIVNDVPEAREALARAVSKFTGIAEYGVGGIVFANDSCTAVPAWTPLGTITINTDSYAVTPTGPNAGSWDIVHRELSKVCALLKSTGNRRNIVDPPGDGSTNAPPSATVSATGVTANAFSLCPSTTAAGSYCKLSYATGVNYTGRWCQVYTGQLRCLLR